MQIRPKMGSKILLRLLLVMFACDLSNGMINLTVTNNLYNYLFRRPESVSLSSFPYCYDRVLEADQTTETTTEFSKINSNCDYASSGDCSQHNSSGRVRSALDVYFDVSINQVLEVNERQRSMRLKMTYFLMWTDCRLQWSTKRFPVSELHISIEQFRALGVYVPILMLNEEITPEASKSTEKWILIMSSGTVYLERMYTTELSCAFDISMYPFDTQSCNMTFESVLEKPIVSLANVEEATEAGIIEADRLPSYLSLYHLGMGRFIPSDTWELVVLDGEYNTRNICSILDLVVDPDKCLFDLVIHKIILRRHPSYQLLNLLLPAFLIVTISSCVFLLPPGSADKTNLSITILLSLFIFMQIMYYKMPETGETLPLLTQYYIFCVGLIVFSCIAGTFSVTLDAASLPIPRRIRNFVHRYGNLLVPDRINTEQQLVLSVRRKANQTEAPKVKANTSISVNTNTNTNTNTSTSTNTNTNTSTSSNENEECQWKLLQNGMSKRRSRTHNAHHYEWRHVATIFDRSVFILHTVCSISVLMGYLMWGYFSYINYGFLLTDIGWKYREIQMKMVGDADKR